MNEVSLTRFKRCTKCTLLWPATIAYFHRLKTGRYGVCGSCKRCRCADVTAIRTANREQYRARAREYTGREQTKARRSARDSANRESLRLQAREYYRNNSDKVVAWVYLWRQTEHGRQSYLNSQRKRYEAEKDTEAYRRGKALQSRRRRVRKLDAAGSHTAEEVAQMLRDQGGVCAYCEVDLSGRIEVEHMVPLSRGGSDGWENLAIVCHPCNARKHTRTLEEYWEELRVYNF